MPRSRGRVQGPGSHGGGAMQALGSASLEPRRRMLLLEFDKVGTVSGWQSTHSSCVTKPRVCASTPAALPPRARDGVLVHLGPVAVLALCDGLDNADCVRRLPCRACGFCGSQDLSSHTSEIHSKLVDIMQDRLVQAARQLTQEAARWGTPQGPPPAAPDGSFQPSQALLSLHKQLTTLHTVLGPLLQQEEVQYIFGRVASLYSEALAATLDALQHPKLQLPQQHQAGGGAQGGAGGAQGGGRAGRVAGAMAGSVGVVSASVTVDVHELAAWEDMRRRNAIYALQVRSCCLGVCCLGSGARARPGQADAQAPR